MAQYTGKQSILNESLGEYHAKGFNVTEDDDTFLFLFHEDERIAVFSQMGATISSIRDECQRHLDEEGLVAS